MQRETLLIHRDVADAFLPEMETALKEYNVELRADERAREILKDSKAKNRVRLGR